MTGDALERSVDGEPGGVLVAAAAEFARDRGGRRRRTSTACSRGLRRSGPT